VISPRIILLSLLGSITVLPILILPIMVGAMVDSFGLSDSTAAYSASFNFVGGALVAIPIALRVHHLNLRTLLIAGLVLAALGDLLSAYTANQEIAFLVMRFLAGVGQGVAYTAVVTAIARLAVPDRAYGLFMMFQFALSALGLYVLPPIVNVIGAQGMYVGLAVIELSALLLAPCVSREIVAAKSDEANIELKTILKWVALLALFATILFEAANTAQFAFIERIGVDIALNDNQIGTALGLASIIAVPASFAVVWLGPRFGRLKPTVFAVALGVSGLLLLLVTNSYATYFVASTLLAICWAFGLPYFQSILAELDHKGSVAAAGSFAVTIGEAMGPAMGASQAETGEYAGVIWISIALFIVSIALILPATRTKISGD